MSGGEGKGRPRGPTFLNLLTRRDDGSATDLNKLRPPQQFRTSLRFTPQSPLLSSFQPKLASGSRLLVSRNASTLLPFVLFPNQRIQFRSRSQRLFLSENFSLVFPPEFPSTLPNFLHSCTYVFPCGTSFGSTNDKLVDNDANYDFGKIYIDL